MEKGTGVYLDSFSSFMLDITSCLSSCFFLSRCTVFKVLQTINALGKGRSFGSVQCHTHWLVTTATHANSDNILKLNKNHLGENVQERPNTEGRFFLLFLKRDLLQRRINYSYLLKPHFEIAWRPCPHCLSGGVQDQHEQLCHLS